MKGRKYQVYNQLIEEIRYLEEILRYTQREYERVYKKSVDTKPQFNGVVQYGGERVQGGHIRLKFDKALEKLDKLNQAAHSIEQELAEKHKERERIEKAWERLEGLEYKVFYMRFVEGMTIEQIACELDYSFDRIAQVSAGINRETVK